MARLQASCLFRSWAATGDESTVVAKGLEAQLPLGASPTLEGVVAETHSGHELEQKVEAGGIAQAVLLQDDQGLIGS